MSTEALRESVADDFASSLCGSARNTCRMSLGRNCNWGLGLRRPPEEPSFGLPSDQLVSMRLPLEDGLTGRAYLIVSTADGAMLADLMMMGDGSAPWAPDHLDALTELGNQIGGALATMLSERWTRRVAIRGCDAQLGEEADAGGYEYPIQLEIQDIETRTIVLRLDADLVSSLAVREEESQPQGSPAAGFDGLGIGFGTPASSPYAVPASDAPRQFDSQDPALGRLLGIPLEVTIELGQTELSIRKVLEIGPGSIIELNRLATEPVDLVINGNVIAKGEVVVVDENFGIRITSLLSPEERIRNLK